MISMVRRVLASAREVSAASVQDGLRHGCDRSSMRLQLKTASTGMSSRSHGHCSEPGWWKPAWYGIGEWTREPRMAYGIGQE